MEERRPPQGARQPRGPLRFVATRRFPFRERGKLIHSPVDVYCAR